MPTEIKVKAPKAGGREYVGSYDFGDNLDEAKEKFGEKLVYLSYLRSQVIKLQTYIRNLLEAGTSDEEITQFIAAWQPSAQRVGVSRAIVTQAAILAQWAQYTDEEKRAFIEKLRNA